MENKLTQEVQKVLDNELEKRRAREDSKLDAYQRAIDFFEELKRQGLVKSRGYSLLTIDEVHLHRIPINTPRK